MTNFFDTKRYYSFNVIQFKIPKTKKSESANKLTASILVA
jgi:hypothetical protein